MDTAEEPYAGAREGLLGACRQVDERLARLAGGGADLAAEVHAIRKLGKKLRGGLMIACGDQGQIRQVGMIGRLLGEARDASVLRETWADLWDLEPEEGSVEWVIDAMIGHQADRAGVAPPAEVVAWSREGVARVRETVEQDALLATRCREGSARMLRSLRKRLKRALERVEDEDFHAARKSVKFWLGGMKLVAPEPVEAVAGPLERLGDALGHEHDLQVFGEWMRQHGFTPASAPRVWKRLPKVQSRARRRSLALVRKETLPQLKAVSRAAAKE